MSEFQQNVRYQFAAGLPGEFSNDGPNRTQSFRLVVNPTQAGAPIAFGYAFSYAAVGEFANPNGLASTQTAQPGAASVAAGVFAGVLVNPKEHALYGDNTGALAPVYTLPDGSWGELTRMGILFVNVTTANTAGHGASGNALGFDPVTGIIHAFPAGDAVAANFIAIPGILRTAVGQNVTLGLAKVELTGGLA